MRAALIALAALLPGPLLTGSPWAAPAAPAAASPAPTSFEIDRATALALLARPDRLAGELWLAHPDAEAIKARARGEKVKGPPPPAGLELRGIQPGSTVHGLGLRNHDVLQALDGTAIDGLPTLVAVALRLQARLVEGGGWGFDARLVRDGRPLALRYTVNATPPPDAAGPASAAPSPPAPPTPEAAPAAPPTPDAGRTP